MPRLLITLALCVLALAFLSRTAGIVVILVLIAVNAAIDRRR